jgi:pimeloyl-ACP methyl ester carboxylesterase
LQKYTKQFTAVFLFIFLFVCSPAGTDYSTPFHPFKSLKAKQTYFQFYDKEVKKWPVISETLSVSGTYGQTFIRISGPTEAPPLVLIPGGAVSSLIWTSMVGYLSKDFRVYAIDNIYDLGRSIYRRKMSNSDDFMIWLDNTLDSLKLQRNVFLMGYSNGGWIAARYALHAPNRISATALLAPALTVEPLSFQFWFRVGLCLIPISYFQRSFSNWIFSDLAKQNAMSDKHEPEENETSIGMQCFKIKNSVLPPVLTDNELASFKMPVLFMVGEHEKAFSPTKSIERLRAKAPQIHIEIVKKAGHDLVLVQPGTVSDSIINFFKKNNINNSFSIAP